LIVLKKNVLKRFVIVKLEDGGDSVCSSMVVSVIIDVCGLFIIHNLFGV